jgi:hypothetical protein
MVSLRPFVAGNGGRLAAVFRHLSLFLCGLLLAGLGCHSATKGHRFSGRVTFDGNPIPSGKIYFTPTGKGNTGHAGWANIKDGVYDTAAKGGQGYGGGPTIVMIDGFDGTTPLFPRYQEKVEMPKEPTVKDFDVPAKAAKPKK